jgi:hypothetical protein
MNADNCCTGTGLKRGFAGMLMPALVFWMPMPTYGCGHGDSFSAANGSTLEHFQDLPVLYFRKIIPVMFPTLKNGSCFGRHENTKKRFFKSLPMCWNCTGTL